MEAAVRQSAKPAVVRHCSARYKQFYLKDRKTIMLSVWISTVLVGSPNRAVFTWLSYNQNQSKYTSQPKGVAKPKPKPKPKPIPFDSQVKTALIIDSTIYLIQSYLF